MPDDRGALVLAAAGLATVIVDDPVPPHQLGLGQSEEMTTAVLAGSHPLRAGSYPVEPIQAISRARFRRSHPALVDQWEMLLRLPLVVPTKIS